MSTPKSPLQLTPFDWPTFVKGHFVSLILASTIGSALGVVLVDPKDVSPLLLFSVPLSLTCTALVFVRAWKSVREELETAPIWAEAVEGSAYRGMGPMNVKDARFEPVYVFTLMFLPFSVVSFHTFAACLGLFYVVHRVYWTDLARYLTRKPVNIDRLLLVRYFRRRASLDLIALMVVIPGWLVFAWLQWSGVAPNWTVSVTTAFGLSDIEALKGLSALGIALIPVVVLIGLEMLVDPRGLKGVHFSASSTPANGAEKRAILWVVPPKSRITAEDKGRLDAKGIKAIEELAKTADKSRAVLDSPPRGTLSMVATTEADPSGILAYVILRPEKALVNGEVVIGDGQSSEFQESVRTRSKEIAAMYWPRKAFVEAALPAKPVAPVPAAAQGATGGG